jgi:hypothetical protein
MEETRMGDEALLRKLRIAAEDRLLLVGAPAGYLERLGRAADTDFVTAVPGAYDVVHVFVPDHEAVERDAPKALTAVRHGGVVWMSYPKRSSRVPTDITRDAGWDVLDAAGWEGVAQVSVDEVWSAVRFRPSADVVRRSPAATDGA